MPLSFVDAAGHRGRITDEFSVEYGGFLPVEEYVDAVVSEAASAERATEELILGMVAELDVEEVRREEDVVPAPSPTA